jgi:putative flavoprotein involved in K+ transport
MSESIDVVVIGGGQAGLATSHELTSAGVEHVVLERGRVGQTWRTRWESFCLVTPNWSVRLPGRHYDGHDPDGFMLRDEIVAYLERYASGFGAPVREGIEVTSVSGEPAGGRGFVVRTSAGELRARSVVVATGSYRRANRPEGARSLPAGLPQLDVEAYRSPAGLDDGGVLVVGSGQSGCQVAEELRGAGREVYLACGRAPWLPRRIGEHDLMWWVLESRFFEQRVEQLPTPAARLGANVLATGRDGGHDLNLRTLREAGVTLLGRFLGADGRHARFADDLGASVAWGDDRYRELRERFSAFAAERGLPAPPMPEPPDFDGAAPQELDLAAIGAVVFSGGFRPDFGWVDVPGAFDELGFPRQTEGASSVADGLYFVGVHFLRTRKSSLLCGVGEDAAIVARQVAAAA